MDDKVGLGYTVQDVISGFKGVVEHMSHYANQGTMAIVQPDTLDRDGKRIECEAFDVTQLKVLETKPPFDIPPPPPQLFQFGDKVKCKFTGYSGTVTGRAVYINGCSRVYVQPQYNSTSQAKNAEGKFIAEGSLEATERVKKEDVPAPTKRGGPELADSSLEW